MNDETNPWTILGQQSVYDNPWINVTEFDVLNPSGGKGIYGKVHFKNYAIGIIPLDEFMNTWLVGQYRFTLNQYTWEIPEGGCAEDEVPLEAAKRELEEETGLRATSWSKLLDVHLSNSISDENGSIFLARGLSQHHPKPEETEALRIKKLPFEEVYNMVLNGTITDSLTMLAVLKVKNMQLFGLL